MGDEVVGEMKKIILLGAIVLALLAFAGAVVWRDVRRHSHAEDELAGEAAHEHAPGEVCEDCLKEALAMAEAEAGNRAAAQVVTFQVQLPPQKGARTKVRIHTSMGDIDVVLFDDLVPETVRNFLELTKKGFYSGLVFHRVIADFMIQTGCPLGTGRGGPGYTFADEFADGLVYDKPGVLGMANRGKNTNGSQFFITVKPRLDLNWKYSVFGQVVAGMDVVASINGVATDANDRPLEVVTMESVEILGSFEGDGAGQESARPGPGLGL